MSITIILTNIGDNSLDRGLCTKITSEQLNCIKKYIK